MDDLASQLAIIQDEEKAEEVEEEEETRYLTTVAMAFFVLGAEGAWQQQIKNRCPSHLYLQ